ncbi:hypothetical protein DIPPA_16137 [Diplonema papillatum]|nr:hypothetical protein DIPPA_16137 [Diplonema papillatum]
MWQFLVVAGTLCLISVLVVAWVLRRRRRIYPRKQPHILTSCGVNELHSPDPALSGPRDPIAARSSPVTHDCSTPTRDTSIPTSPPGALATPCIPRDPRVVPRRSSLHPFTTGASRRLRCCMCCLGDRAAAQDVCPPDECKAPHLPCVPSNPLLLQPAAAEVFDALPDRRNRRSPTSTSIPFHAAATVAVHQLDMRVPCSPVLATDSLVANPAAMADGSGRRVSGESEGTVLCNNPSPSPNTDDSASTTSEAAGVDSGAYPAENVVSSHIPEGNVPCGPTVACPRARNCEVSVADLSPGVEISICAERSDNGTDNNDGNSFVGSIDASKGLPNADNPSKSSSTDSDDVLQSSQRKPYKEVTQERAAVRPVDDLLAGVGAVSSNECPDKVPLSPSNLVGMAAKPVPSKPVEVDAISLQTFVFSEFSDLSELSGFVIDEAT